jgi:hypothetical protein
MAIGRLKNSIKVWGIRVLARSASDGIDGNVPFVAARDDVGRLSVVAAEAFRNERRFIDLGNPLEETVSLRVHPNSTLMLVYQAKVLYLYVFSN